MIRVPRVSWKMWKGHLVMISNRSVGLRVLRTRVLQSGERPSWLRSLMLHLFDKTRLTRTLQSSGEVHLRYLGIIRRHEVADADQLEVAHRAAVAVPTWTGPTTATAAPSGVALPLAHVEVEAEGLEGRRRGLAQRLRSSSRVVVGTRSRTGDHRKPGGTGRCCGCGCPDVPGPRQLPAETHVLEATLSPIER